MEPLAFDDLVKKMRQTKAFGSGKHTEAWVGQRLGVALYRLGRSGNGSGVSDTSNQCDCSVGSVVNYTNMTLAGLEELALEIMIPATEHEKAAASAWVKHKTGVEEWGRGWLAVDETKIDLAWRPALNQKENYNDKESHALNMALVVLPHSLRIVEYVVEYSGFWQDSRVWASYSPILKKPRHYLDEGEFIWTDGSCGFSAFTVGPYSHESAAVSKDLRKFNDTLSCVRTRAEHAIAYLKNRFQCLKGYRGNIYRLEDADTASKVVTSCIILHTFASRYDNTGDTAGFPSLGETTTDNYSPDEVADTTSQDVVSQIKRRRARAQKLYERQQEQEARELTRHQRDIVRREKGAALRNEMFCRLFEEPGNEFVDTDAR